MIRAAAAWLSSVVVGLAVLAPSATAAVPNSAVQLSALSCPSSGNCSLVGTYDDALGNSQGLLASEAQGSWTRAVRAQAPAGASIDAFKQSNGGGLVDISCPAGGDCTAVGRYTDAAGIDHAMAISQAHGGWSRGVRLKLPANAIAAKRTKSGVTDDLGLAGLSCSSVGNCVAVGNYETDAEVWEAMIIVEAHGRWTRAVEAPLPAGAPVAGQDAVLLTVTCANGQCSAAGDYVDAAGHQQSLLLSGSGDTWLAAPAPASPGDANVDPNIVPSTIACADAHDCAAVGTYVNPLQNSLGLLLSESAGKWAAGTGATLPANAAPTGTVGDQTVVLSSVACPQPGACTAVGWYFDNYENGQGLVLGQQHGSWQPGVEITLPANAVTGLEKQSAGLDWISCASLGNCLATGVYTDNEYNSQGLLLSESGGVWQTGLESPLPGNAGNVEYAAVNQSACTGAGACTVIGQYTDRHGNVLGYTLSEAGGAWGAATEVQLPAPTLADVKLSLFRILIPIDDRSAQLAQIRRSRRYVFQYPAVESGTATVSWYAEQGPSQVVVATGTARVRGPGSARLELRLTAAGRQLMATARQLRVSATARFVPRGRHRTQSASARFTLN